MIWRLRMIRGLFLALTATPAVADPGLIDFLGGQGCTIGTDSRAAALAAGFDAAAMDALVAGTLADGRASQQGAYVVLNEATCTIRLPDITSAYTVTSPEVRAMTSANGALGEPGCFLSDGPTAFAALHGGDVDAGFADYIAFVGAGLISGDLRFHAPSPLATPAGFQVLTGDCSQVPNIDAIRRSHAFLASRFGDYIRAVGAEIPCNAAGFGGGALDLPARMQGADPALPLEDQPEINAWLWFEYEMIAMAAGWHEGMTGTEKGTPRPPLCHYP
jgi:hypothetical protein